MEEYRITRDFSEVVQMIRNAHSRLLYAANTALIDLYWQFGEYISERIAQSAWGAGVVEQLSSYIARQAPELKGGSNKNLWRMKPFFETYRGADPKLSALLREISWTNNLLIMSRAKSDEE